MIDQDYTSRTLASSGVRGLQGIIAHHKSREKGRISEVAMKHVQPLQSVFAKSNILIVKKVEKAVSLAAGRRPQAAEIAIQCGLKILTEPLTESKFRGTKR